MIKQIDSNPRFELLSTLQPSVLLIFLGRSRSGDPTSSVGWSGHQDPTNSDLGDIERIDGCSLELCIHTFSGVIWRSAAKIN